MKNFIVYKSSAGSGKTYNLAINYISLSLGSGGFRKDYFKRILAITFTNKAAKEMKERILQYLHTLSQQKDVDNILHEIKLKTKLSEKLIFKFSKDLYSYIIHNYSRTSWYRIRYIRTILIFNICVKYFIETMTPKTNSNSCLLYTSPSPRDRG